MGVFDQIRGRRTLNHTAETFAQPGAMEEKTPVEKAGSHSGSDSDTLSLEAQNEEEIQQHPDQVTADAHKGIQKAEAAALVWTKPVLYATFAWIWVCFFMLAFQSSVMSYASVAAYSSFSTAPAYTTAQILATIIGGVLKLPIAKLINIWGRTEGYVTFFFIYLLGILIIASSNGVNSYAAGYVLYWIGYDAVYLILDIFVADTTGLRNRAFAWGFISTPFICTAFTGPLAADAFLATTTWRWAVGAFCIIQPVVFLPLAGIFKFYQKKAEKMGLLKKEDSGRSVLQSFVHYFHEFDMVGCVLLMLAFILFLLPFSLQSYGRADFSSATFIAMVVIGLCLFPVFYIWERYFARVHFVRWELVRERTVLGACILAAVLYFSFYSWDLQYYNYVKVTYALPVKYAGYMSQIYNIGSCFWSVVFGAWVYATKRFKYTCLFFGLPLMFLGSGLMVHFRGGDHGIGYVVMCQIFIAIAGGTLVIGEDMAVMTAADREGVPMMLSIIYLASNIGGSIGTAVSTSIYGNTFPSALARALPADLQGKVSELYLGGYLTQELFVPGTVERTAINYAWGQTQYYSCISAVAVLVLGIPAIAIWKNYRVDKQQNKGVMI
ncbi:Putative major facilitator superfamily, MFS transporter superfamily [Septoria linicola]|uniref:Major facilitator superfamily, MFS transporter superfamily n=1 Tax=Septoria linicola TaxID=215465 RepID=A0A9Q9AX32_9PEZI|nr:putative major facilitator superfamily, MFS transporter superfamily [Septoria linicola]USW54085.1 Putative major facilitator superfamily, MFS transporter superfamily [Septoria linicola]